MSGWWCGSGGPSRKLGGGEASVVPLSVHVSFSLLFYSVRYSRAGTVFSIPDFPALARVWHIVNSGHVLAVLELGVFPLLFATVSDCVPRTNVLRLFSFQDIAANLVEFK